MPLILGTNSIKDIGYDVANSCRFDDGDNARISKTFSSAGNSDTWTMSAWVKRSTLGANSSIFTCNGLGAGAQKGTIRFDSSDKISAYVLFAGSAWHYITSNAVYRDTSAWYHVVVRCDTTQSTDTDRLRLYVNGTLQTLSGSTYPDQNEDTFFNEAEEHQVASLIDETEDFDGYMAEFCWIDGSSLAPDQFGEFDSDSGIWKPIDVSGLTFGTNGVYLDFEDSSDLGKDASGNSDWTATNLSAVDQTTDTCTNNFCTINPLIPGGSVTLQEGNLKVSAIGDNDWRSGTFGGSLKWYAECKINVAYDGSGGGICIGAVAVPGLNESGGQNGDVFDMAGSDAKWYTNSNDGKFQEGGGTNLTTGLTRASTNDIVGVACDSANGRIYIHVNGTYLNSGDPTGGSGFIGGTTAYQGVWLPFIGSHLDKGQGTWNFGSPPFTISSGNSDGDGYGNFEYAVPSGYYALNTKNLAEYG
nr:spry domain protein [uncultured Mediterranean phage uvMED]